MAKQRGNPFNLHVIVKGVILSNNVVYADIANLLSSVHGWSVTLQQEIEIFNNTTYRLNDQLDATYQEQPVLILRLLNTSNNRYTI